MRSKTQLVGRSAVALLAALLIGLLVVGCNTGDADSGSPTATSGVAPENQKTLEKEGMSETAPPTNPASGVGGQTDQGTPAPTGTPSVAGGR